MSESGKSLLEGKAYREFVSEAEEILEQLRADLSDLLDQQARLTGDSEVDPDLLNRVFRSAHSLKGLAGMFGLAAIGDLSHHLEDVLDSLRLGRIAIDSPAVALLDSCVSLLARLLEGIGDPERQAEGDEAVAAKIEEIREAVSGVQPEDVGFGDLSLDPQLLRALTEYEEHRLRENIRRGRHLSLVDSVFEILAFEEGLAELSSAIREVGEIVSTLPSPGDAPDSQIRFSLLVSSKISSDELRARLEFPETTVQSVLAAPQSEASDSASRPQTPSASSGEAIPDSLSAPPAVAEPSAPSDPQDARPSGPAPEIESLRSISDTVRVDIRKLDELMNLVGELVIHRGAIQQIAGRLSAEPETARIGGELVNAQKLMDRKLKELQAGVLDVRMVPLRQVFEKLTRVVRRLRRDLGKEVTFEFKGGDTELDKLIVEQISNAGAEQDRGHEVVYRSAVTMREVAQQVRRTTSEQSRGFGRIRESVEGVREATEQINGALQEQSDATRQAMEFLELAAQGTRGAEDARDGLDSSQRTLVQQADLLRQQVAKFRL